MENGTAAKCPERCGTMPSCAPLAMGFVPFQQEDSPRYNQRDGLSNGTLFQGLNLPFHLMEKSSSLPDTEMTELQALCFAVQELALYLDTHPNDKEAFALFKQLTAAKKSADKAYESSRGKPLMRSSAASGDRYTWLQDPWPWNYDENEVK